MRTRTILPSKDRAGARTLAKVAVVALLATGVAGAAGPAEAAGKSGLLFNCYTQWWNTAYAQGCEGSGAKLEGRYRSHVDCSGPDSGRTFDHRWQKGETGLVHAGDCTWGITDGDIAYLG